MSENMAMIHKLKRRKGETEQTLTMSLWYRPMATSMEITGSSADSQVIVEIRQSTLSDDRMPVLERQRYMVTESMQLGLFEWLS